jgi:transketolase
MYAAHNKVDNLIATIDFNGQQIDGSTKDIMGFTNLSNKFEAFGWTVLEADGHDLQNLKDTMYHAKTICGQQKPVVIIMRTEMGFGVDFMMGSHKWHGIPPDDAQLATALEQLQGTIGDY